jgi:hypothetical protein
LVYKIKERNKWKIIEEAANAVGEEASDPADPEKCTKQRVLTANRKQRYLLYHQATDLYIAGNVTRNISHRDIELFFLIVNKR